MNGPACTVVIAAYNAERTIGAAVTSVLRQTRSDWELIVVDDGSTDATADRMAVLARDERIRVLRQENGGPGVARNTGIAHARGRFVSLLDSDDLLLPRYLEVMTAALERDPRAGFAYTDAWVLEEPAGRIRRRSAMHKQRGPAQPPAESRELLRLLLRDNFVWVAATIRRSVLEEVGGFDPAFRTSEDYELWLRIAAHGYRAARPPGLLVLARDRPDSLSSDPVRMLGSARDVYRLVAEQYPIPADLRALARDRMAAVERECAAFAGTGGLAGRTRVAAWRRASSVKRSLVGRRRYLPAPPRDVALAFPDLEHL